MAKLPVWVSALVTVTLTVPAARAPVVQLIEVALTTVTPVHATPPIDTVAPVIKLVPVMVTEVPPAKAPAAGEITVTVGAP